MKSRLVIITKMILTIVVFFLLNIILRIIPQVIVALLETCCMEFDVSSEFKQHIFLFISYGICDFIAILISLFIFNRKNDINNKIFMIIFMIVLILSTLYIFIGTYNGNYLSLLGNLNIYLILINVLFIIINCILIRKKLLKR